MMRRIGSFLALALALTACLPVTAQASISYQYVTDQSSYTVNAGSTLTVNLYLQESLTGSSQSLIAGDGGMLGAALEMDQTSGTSGTTITGSHANVGSSTVWGSSSFELGGDTGTLTATHAQIGVNAGTNLGQASNVNPDATGKILIGTVTLTAGSSAGTGTYTLVQYGTQAGTPEAGNTVTSGTSAASLAAGSAYDLDYTNNNSPATGGQPSGAYTGTLDDPYFFTVTVAAVPEPNGLVLSGLAGGLMVVGLGYAGYRRRMAQLLKVDAAA